MALVVVAAGVWTGYRQLTKPSCSGQIRLSLAAAPEIAPAVKAVAENWSSDGGKANGECVTVQVAAAEPVDVAAAVAGRQGTTLTGVGQASGATQVPDVWIPDSSTWLLRLQAAAPGLAPTSNPSVARSPVVIAVPEPVATQLGWPAKKLTYTDMLQALTSGNALRPGIVEPTRDAAGLSGLLALAAVAGSAGANAQEATAAVLRTLAVGKSSVPDDLLAKFPKASDAAAVASSLSAAPLSEQTLIDYNKAQPPVRLAALYLTPDPPPLDYPFVVLPGLDSDRIAAANALLGALGKGSFHDQLAGAGLRSADGTAGNGFAAPRGAPVDATPTPVGASASPSSTQASGGAASAALDASTVDRALSTWTAVTAPGRLLAVLDVSGSMKEKVPTAGNASRMQVTVEAARRGLGLFDDSWDVGLWIFSTNLDGARDYRQLVPVGPVATQRTRLLNALGTVNVSSGNTGLYDTVLASYKNVQAGYDPGRPNSVVVMTDGQNEDSNGISLAALLSELKRVADPKRPVKIIFIGIGDGVSEAELTQISKPTSGGVFLAKDPSQIGEIFIKAIALHRGT
jgi:Ca-activated chloride channel family protein